IIQIFLALVIAGMEVGHTIVDLYRSTAFGGFILFIPLLICAIFVLITVCKSRNINSSNKADSDDSPRRQNYVTTKPAKNDMKKNPSSPFNNTYQKGQIQTYMIQNQYEESCCKTLAENCT
ncbi:unnamed protein product, partial [Didymodactylos carnosus]